MTTPFKLSKLYWLLAVWFIFSACQKDDDLEDVSLTLTAFSIESETKQAIIDDLNKTITVSVGDMMDWTDLSVTFNTGSGTQLVYEGEELISGSSTLDLTRPVTLVLRSSRDGQQETWSIEVESLIADYGLGNILHRAASVDEGRLFYLDQLGTGPHEYLNCGPTVTTMTIKWGYPNYTGTPQQAREAILPGGGWWYTNHIVYYLTQHGMHIAYADLENISDTEYGNRLMNIIDRGYVGILCLDMYYVLHETDSDKRTNKFYQTNAADWGHFVLVKGYKVVDGRIWLEVHDPYSIDHRYASDNQFMGKNRYYEASELKKATDVWWPFSIVASPETTPVLARGALSKSRASTLVHQRGR